MKTSSEMIGTSYRAGDCGEFVQLLRACDHACGIVGRDQDDSPRLGADLPFKMFQIDRPVLRLIQFIVGQSDAAEPGDVVEQRIGRLRRKDFVPGSASNLKQYQ